MKKPALIIVFLVTVSPIVGASDMDLRAQERGSRSMLVNSIGTSSLQKKVAIPLSELLQKFEQEFRVTFLYKDNIIAGKFVNTGDLEINKKTAKKLFSILNNHGLNYHRIDEQTYVLSRKPEKLEKVTLAEQVSGTVIDAQSGEPLPGVNVLVKGTSIGASTNTKGFYSLNPPSLTDTLVFSFIGYQTREVPIHDRTTIDIELQSQTIAGDEMVVVGYGTTQKSDLTGSISSVSSEDLEELPSASMEELLQGRASGTQVVKQSGQPGGGISIRIRGSGSIQAGTQPLYVVDGFPIYSSNNVFDGLFSEQVNALSFINPDDIESIEILKDASATAIYGSRGANGVVLITTKGGGDRRTQVEFETSQGFSSLSNKLDLMNTDQMEQARREFVESQGGTFNPIPESYQNVNTDWQDLVYRRAMTSNYQLSVSGGNEKTSFYASGSLADEEGIIRSSGFQKGSIRLNLDHDINDKFNINSNLTFSKSIWDGVFTGASGGGSFGSIVQNAAQLPSFFSPYDEQGNVESYEDFGTYSLERRLYRNGITIAEGVRIDREDDRFLGNVAFNYQITPKLALRITAGLDYVDRRNDFSTTTEFSRHDRDSRLLAEIGEINTESWVNENTLTYQTTINQDHDLNILAGFTQQQETFVLNNTSGTGFPNDELGTSAMQLAEELQVNSNKTRWNLLSGIGRINYTFNDKYLLTASLRADGASKFGDNSKWGVFPSGALGWRLSEEDFIQQIDFISNLKLRASWGVTGNQEIGTYRSLRRLESGQAAFNNELVPSIFLSDIPSENLTWEETSQIDFGIDLGLFEDRISFTADYFRKETNNLLVDLPQPLTSGINVVTRNVGSVENKGLEFSITSRNLTGGSSGGLGWTTSANLSTLENEILDLGGINDFPIGRNLEVGGFTQLTIGEPIGAFYGYRVNGIWQQDEQAEAQSFGFQPGDRKFVDLNEDGAITPADRTFIGKPLPDVTWSISNRFDYRGFDLSIFIRGQAGSQVYNHTARYLTTTLTNSYEEAFTNRWTPENPSNDTPRLGPNLDARVHEGNVEDADFIRLQNVKLGYDFSASTLQKVGVRNAYFYISAQNLLTITDYRGYDPEVNSAGQNNQTEFAVDHWSYPRARTFTAGLRMTF